MLWYTHPPCINQFRRQVAIIISDIYHTILMKAFLILSSSFGYTILLTNVTLCVMGHQDFLGFLAFPVDQSPPAPSISWAQAHFNQ